MSQLATPVATGEDGPMGRGWQMGVRGPAVVAAILSSALYSWIGLARYGRGEYGNYDLGIFLQAASSWVTTGRPYSEIKGINLLGDHFSPITAVFGGAYALWPDPRSLILTQSVSLGIMVGPVSYTHLTLPTKRIV